MPAVVSVTSLAAGSDGVETSWVFDTDIVSAGTVLGYAVTFDDGATWVGTVSEALNEAPFTVSIVFSTEDYEGQTPTGWRVVSGSGVVFVGGGSIADGAGDITDPATVLDSILLDVQTAVSAAVVAKGFDAGDVELDEFGFDNWPPTAATDDPDSDGVLVLISSGPESENPNRASGCDAWTVEIGVGLSVSKTAEQSDAANYLAISKRIKIAIIKALRVDLSRGGYADNTMDFTAAPWSWGDGTGGGFTIRFKVIFRTNYNDPFTKG